VLRSDVPDVCKNMIRNEILRQCRSHVAVLDRLMSAQTSA
jgi:hypothetical protein